MASLPTSTSRGDSAKLVRQGQTYSGAYGSQPFAKRRGISDTPTDAPTV